MPVTPLYLILTENSTRHIRWERRFFIWISIYMTGELTKEAALISLTLIVPTLNCSFAARAYIVIYVKT